MASLRSPIVVGAAWGVVAALLALAGGCRGGGASATQKSAVPAPTEKGDAMVVRYADRQGSAVSMDAQGNLVLGASPAATATVVGVVSRVNASSAIAHPSVGAESQAIVAVRPSALVSGRRISEIRLIYDEKALLLGPIQQGDRLLFTFDLQGALVDVVPMAKDGKSDGR